jgi:N-acyl homoserine lactone hydrolase
MRVHVLETGIAVVRERQLAGVEPLRKLRTVLTRSPWAPIPVRAWLIEHPAGLILVDTGQTARANEPGYLPRESLYYRRSLKLRISPEEEVGPQMRALGFDPSDIRWTILTHLHLDHDGGLSHVLDSEIVVSAAEYRFARGLAGRLRGYLPHRWPEGFKPHLVTLPDRAYGPFPRSLELTSGIILVDTAGHTPGHISVVIEGEPRLFFAGDAIYGQEQLQRGVVDGIATDADAARETMARIRALAAERETVILPTHDPGAPDRLLPRDRHQHRRFAPRVVEDAQRDAVEPDQVSAAEAARRPRDAS